MEATAFFAQNTFLIGDWTLTPGVRVEQIEQTKVLFSGVPGTANFQQEDMLDTSETETLPGIGFTWNGLENPFAMS